jgi:hypothetical protein
VSPAGTAQRQQRARVRAADRRCEALDAVCDHRLVDRQILELVLQALRGEIATDAASRRVPDLQAIQRGFNAAKAALQGEKLELAKHDDSPRE